MSNFKSLLNHVKAFAFDVDGVFTDGQVYLFPKEDFVRAVNIKDGYAIQHCIKMGQLFPVENQMKLQNDSRNSVLLTSIWEHPASLNCMKIFE